MARCSTNKTLVAARIIWLSVLASFIALDVSAEKVVNPMACSAHFQARALWLRGLDQNQEAVEMMESYAEILWLSVPKDCGMNTGMADTSCAYEMDQVAVLDQLTLWALEGNGTDARPLCMEDPFCVRCTAMLNRVVR